MTRGALLPRRDGAVGAVWEEQFREELCWAVPFPIPGGGIRDGRGQIWPRPGWSGAEGGSPRDPALTRRGRALTAAE